MPVLPAEHFEHDENQDRSAESTPEEEATLGIGQNNGRLSACKRESHFPQLTPEELAQMEEVARAAYAHPSPAAGA